MGFFSDTPEEKAARKYHEASKLVADNVEDVSEMAAKLENWAASDARNALYDIGYGTDEDRKLHKQLTKAKKRVTAAAAFLRAAAKQYRELHAALVEKSQVD